MRFVTDLKDEDIKKWIFLLKRMDMAAAVRYLTEIIECAIKGSYGGVEKESLPLSWHEVVARKKYKCGCGCKRVIKPKDHYICFTSYKSPIHYRLRVHKNCQDEYTKDYWLKKMGLK